MQLQGRGYYKHWTRGPGTQRSSSVALSFYDRNATCVNVLSSNVRLYCCWSQSPHLIHSVDAFHTRLCYFTLSASFLYLFFTLQTQELVSFIAYKTTSVTSSWYYSHCDPRVKGQMQIVSRLSRSACRDSVQAWLCKSDSRLL